MLRWLCIAVNVLVLLAFSLEIHSYWWLQRWQGGGRFYSYYLTREYWMYAQFSYSAFFMLYGGILLAVGFVKRSAFLRWQALILLAATVAKVFLIDTEQLNQGLRILSFIGLGVLLLCVSYVYQRDWLNLRGRKDGNDFESKSPRWGCCCWRRRRRRFAISILSDPSRRPRSQPGRVASSSILACLRMPRPNLRICVFTRA